MSECVFVCVSVSAYVSVCVTLTHNTCVFAHSKTNYRPKTALFTTDNITYKLFIYVKGKGLPRTGHEGPEGKQMYSSTLPSTSALDEGGWSTPRPGRFTPGKDPVGIVQEAGWAPGPVWTGAESLPPHRYSIPGPSSP